MDFECKGEVKISMIPYVKVMIKKFPEKVGTSTAATPAADHLFQGRKKEDAKLLPEEQAIKFHHSVAQLLFVSTRHTGPLNSCRIFE